MEFPEHPHSEYEVPYHPFYFSVVKLQSGFIYLDVIMLQISFAYLSLKRLAFADGKSKRCGVSARTLPVFTFRNFFLSELYTK